MAARRDLAPNRGHPAATCCERTALRQVGDHKCPLLRVAQERLSAGMGYKLDDMKTHTSSGYLMILIKCLALSANHLLSKKYMHNINKLS